MGLNNEIWQSALQAIYFLITIPLQTFLKNSQKCAFDPKHNVFFQEKYSYI